MQEKAVMTDIKHITKGSSRILALFAVGAAFALPTVAHAQRSIIPSTVCEHWPDPGNAPASVIRVFHIWPAGKRQHDPTTDGGMPGYQAEHRDPTPLAQGLYPRSYGRWWHDRSLLSCTLRSNNPWGTNWVDLETISTSASGNANNFAMTFHNVDSVQADGNYVLQCTLPPYDGTDEGQGEGGAAGRSSIGSIVIDEP